MSDLLIERAYPARWRAAKELRLRALAEAPAAFASTLGAEQAFDDDTWRGRLRESAWFIAHEGDRDVGLAVGLVELAPGTRHLVGMWVAPERRGTDAAAALVHRVRDWARDEGAHTLILWVAATNLRARRFYERLGFRATGEHQPLPSDPSIREDRMSLDL